MTEENQAAAERYTADAAEAFRMAQIVKGREDKAAWLKLAERWTNAAEQCHRRQYPTDMPALWL